MNLISKRLTAPAALALVLFATGPAALAAPAPESFAPLAEKVTPAREIDAGVVPGTWRELLEPVGVHAPAGAFEELQKEGDEAPQGSRRGGLVGGAVPVERGRAGGRDAGQGGEHCDEQDGTSPADGSERHGIPPGRDPARSPRPRRSALLNSKVSVASGIGTLKQRSLLVALASPAVSLSHVLSPLPTKRDATAAGVPGSLSGLHLAPLPPRGDECGVEKLLDGGVRVLLPPSG